MKKEIDKSGRPILSFQKILENEELADRAPDSTKNNEGRPHTWNPPVITVDEHFIENPYNKF